MNKKITLATFIFLLHLLFISSSHANETDPGKIVQTTVNQVLDILSHMDMSEKEKREQISNTVSEHTNFTGMSRRILALNWKKASEQQKEAFTQSFKQILMNTYW